MARVQPGSFSRWVKASSLMHLRCEGLTLGQAPLLEIQGGSSATPATPPHPQPPPHAKLPASIISLGSPLAWALFLCRWLLALLFQNPPSHASGCSRRPPNCT